VTSYRLVIYTDVSEEIVNSIFYHEDAGIGFLPQLITRWKILYSCSTIKKAWSDLSEEFLWFRVYVY